MHNEKLGFEIYFPESWKSLENHPKSMTLAYTSKVKGAQTHAIGTLAVTTLEFPVSLESVADQLITSARPMPRFELIERNGIKLGGGNGKRITFCLDKTSQGSVRTDSGFQAFAESRFREHNILCIAMNGNRTFTIGFRCLMDDYPKYVDEIDGIIKSFKMLQSNGDAL